MKTTPAAQQVRARRWVQVALILFGAIVMAVAGPGGIGVMAGLGLLVLLPGLLFVDDPRTARGLPVATGVMLAAYAALLVDFRHDALGDAFAFVAFAAPFPAAALCFQALCLGVARFLPRRGDAR